MNIKTILKTVGTLSLLNIASVAYADDYEVAGGTFFMQDVSTTPTSIAGNEKGTNGNGVFSTDVFDGSAYATVSADSLFGATTADIDANATDTGLASFPFFGKPVYTYFAADGVDNDGLSFTDPTDGSVWPDTSTNSHPAISIDLVAGTADISSMYAYWSGTEFNQGSSTAAVVDNGDGTYTLSWSSLIIGGAFHGFTGDWTLTVCPGTCPVFEDADGGKISVTQGGGGITRTLVESGPDVTIVSSIDSSVFDYNWGASSAELTSRLVFFCFYGTPPVGAPCDTVHDELKIDMTTVAPNPTDLPPGVYEINLVAIDNNADPKRKAVSSMQVRVVSGFAGLNLRDDDNDGIPNEYDLLSDNTHLSIESGNITTYLMETSAGSFSPGFIGVCNNSYAAGVSATDITNLAGRDCSPVTNATDQTNTVLTGLGDRYYDFIVDEFTAGSTLDIVIPLNTTIPVNAGWRQYTRKSGWQPFNSEGADTTSSAAATATGVCPATDSTSWTPGLTVGHNCVKLSIVDGGPNDEDGFANGSIKSTGALSNWPGLTTGGADISVGILRWKQEN